MEILYATRLATDEAIGQTDLLFGEHGNADRIRGVPDGFFRLLAGT
jgi:hypothetical protein